MQIAQTLSAGRREFPSVVPALAATGHAIALALFSTYLLAVGPAAAAPKAGMLAQLVAPPAPVESAPLPPPPGTAPLAPGNPIVPGNPAVPGSPASPGSPPSIVAPPAISAPLSPLPQSGAAGSPLTPPTGPLPPSNPGAPQQAVPQQVPPGLPQPGLPPQGELPPAALPQPGGQISTSAPPRDLSNEPDLIELVIEPRPVLILQAEASNDDAFPALLAALTRLGEEARKAGVVITGRPFAVIDLTDDKALKFQAMLPVDNTATTPPIPGLRFGQSPSGKAIRFKYAGAYEDNTYVYESIEAYIEEREIKARPYAIEEFLTDPKDANDASLQMFIYYLRE